MSQTKSYQFLSKKQAVKIIVWSIFNKKPFLIYAEAVLMGGISHNCIPRGIAINYRTKNNRTMRPNELRIGNLILFENKVLEAATIGTDFCMLSDGTDTYDAWYDEMQPIPLTQELLVKCGFEPTPHFTVVNSHTIGLGRGRVLSIGNTENANQMAWIESVDGSTVTDLICVHNFDYDGKMHLHQLQNLFYAITGEELTIEL